ncbi:hypothetical protein Aeh1ORF305c [Aeromonas phage Aeh1]|uniref:Uncharacterized protein n=1 Tax=Aeromonas phage Aeh1 TaxID=2880362 RepID=Q76YC1_9CAUD|nr:hypothetical protein Aeh1p324 [Aeromonas phage Aeh1]AAQ17974.1 hypothetical protein Aeh1ORF305c [Aeromonas phage Aeh1]
MDLSIQTLLEKDPEQMTQDETNTLFFYLLETMTDKIENQSEVIKTQNQRLIEAGEVFKLHEKCIGELQEGLIELRKQLDVIKGAGEMGSTRSEGGILLL